MRHIRVYRDLYGEMLGPLAIYLDQNAFLQCFLRKNNCMIELIYSNYLVHGIIAHSFMDVERDNDTVEYIIKGYHRPRGTAQRTKWEGEPLIRLINSAVLKILNNITGVSVILA